MIGVTVSGRLTKDVETKEVSERLVMKMTVASNKIRKPKGVSADQHGNPLDEKGEKIPTADFLPVELWGKPGDGRVEHLKQGTYVIFTGHLEQQRWLDKDTSQPRERWVLAANGFEWGPKKGSGSTAPETEPPAGGTPGGDDLPF